jgi:hypothetical protein
MELIAYGANDRLAYGLIGAVNHWSIQFQGDRGTMLISNAGFKIWKEPWLNNPQPIQQMEAPIPIETQMGGGLGARNWRSPASSRRPGLRYKRLGA